MNYLKLEARSAINLKNEFQEFNAYQTRKNFIQNIIGRFEVPNNGNDGLINSEARIFSFLLNFQKRKKRDEKRK